MQIEVDIESAYELMGKLILSDIELYREQLEGVNMLEFVRMTPAEQQDVVDSAEQLLVLERAADYYCGKDWQSKI